MAGQARNPDAAVPRSQHFQGFGRKGVQGQHVGFEASVGVVDLELAAQDLGSADLHVAVML